MEILSVLSAIKASPMPTILVIGGSLFLLLSLAGGIVGQINIPANRQKYAGIIGGLMLAFGIIIYVSPSPSPSPSSPLKEASVPAGQSKGNKSDEVDLAKIVPEKNLKKRLIPNEWTEVDGGFDGKWTVGSFDLPEQKVYESLIGDVYRFSITYQAWHWTFQIAPYSPSKDFYLGVDFLFHDHKTSQQIEAGLAFRQTSKKYLVLMVTKSRDIGLYFYNGTKWDAVFSWIFLPQLDLKKFNRLEVIAKGDKLRIYVNKRLIQDVTLRGVGVQSGNVSLFVQPDPKNKFPSTETVDFKNFSYIH